MSLDRFDDSPEKCSPNIYALRLLILSLVLNAACGDFNPKDDDVDYSDGIEVKNLTCNSENLLKFQPHSCSSSGEIELNSDTPHISKMIINPIRQNVFLVIEQFLNEDRATIASLKYSEDCGETWHESLDSNGEPVEIYNMAIDNTMPNVVYGLDGGTYLYRSDDWGKTFNQIYNLEEYYYTDADEKYAIYPQIIYTDDSYCGSVYVFSSTSFYKSDDFGQSFELYPYRDSLDVSSKEMHEYEFRKIWNVEKDPLNSDVLYMTTEDKDHSGYLKTPSGGLQTLNYDPFYVMKSEDGGATWRTQSDGLRWHGLEIIPFVIDGMSTTWLFGSEGSGLYYWDNSLKVWERFSEGLRSTYDYLNYDGQVYLATSSGVYVMEDIKTMRPFISTGFKCTTIDAMGNDLYLSLYGVGLVKIPNGFNMDYLDLTEFLSSKNP